MCVVISELIEYEQKTDASDCWQTDRETKLSVNRIGNEIVLLCGFSCHLVELWSCSALRCYYEFDDFKGRN